MRVSLSDPKVRQPSFTRTYLAESYYTAKRDGIVRGAEAEDVLSEILGGTETSRIYRTLVEEKQLAVSAYSDADSSGLGGGSFSVGATPADGVSLEAVETAMDAVIADFLKTGPTDAELARAKANLAASATYAVDDQEQLATIFGASLVTGETVDAVVNWESEIMKVRARTYSPPPSARWISASRLRARCCRRRAALRQARPVEAGPPPSGAIR